MVEIESAWRQKTQAKLNVVAEKIRELKRVTLVELCVNTGVPFSTMHFLKPLILERFHDIRYARGEFWIETPQKRLDESEDTDK